MRKRRISLRCMGTAWGLIALAVPLFFPPAARTSIWPAFLFDAAGLAEGDYIVRFTHNAGDGNAANDVLDATVTVDGFISIYQPYCWFTTDMKAKGTLRLRDTR